MFGRKVASNVCSGKTTLRIEFIYIHAPAIVRLFLEHMTLSSRLAYEMCSESLSHLGPATSSSSV